MWRSESGIPFTPVHTNPFGASFPTAVQGLRGAGEAVIQRDRAAERADDIDESLMVFGGLGAAGVVCGMAADEAADFGVKLAHLGVEHAVFGAQDGDFLVAFADDLEGFRGGDPAV